MLSAILKYNHIPIFGWPRPNIWILRANVSAAVNGVKLCDTLAGHIFFGHLEDKVGRKKAYDMTLKFMVLYSLTSGLSPLSTTIVSEYANKKTRGVFITARVRNAGFH
ncbi:putative inorganic phosphate transporter 1-7 [Platanthera guangdongensis]|uniref:Inorganic phosphate transporter 1-7 n=1 Tax=Platanthera guangdongensis TaxID=2320717 RepID=A0ABR2MR94_9ASPA